VGGGITDILLSDGYGITDILLNDEPLSESWSMCGRSWGARQDPENPPTMICSLKRLHPGMMSSWIRTSRKTIKSSTSVRDT
jgi:hypothetical protein